MKRIIITIIVFILVILGVTLYVNRNNDSFADVANETNTAVIVKSFIDKMIPHHEEAITSSLKVMNDLDITEPKVRIFAANVVDTQSFEIERMKNIYTEYLGVEYVPAIILDSKMSKHSMDKTEGLKGDVLAKVYTDQMIKHHDGAVKMAQDYMKLIDKVKKASEKTENGLTVSNNHPAIESTYELAKQIIEMQEKEIVQLKTWYK